MDLTPTYLEAVVKKWYKKGKVLRVIQLECNNVVEEGDNYTCVTKRVSAKIIDTDGKSKRISFIIKLAPSTAAKRAFIMGFELFPREIQVYRDILPAMEDLLRGHDDFSDFPWTTCVDFQPNNMILLEDLSLSDYRMGDRKEGLDFEHTVLVVGALARFHALSVVLRDRGELKPKDFEKFVFADDNPVLEKLFAKAIESLIESIEQSWSPDWSELLKDLKTLPENITKKIKYVTKRNDSGFNVLNHGDPWTNNMLFKYCPYTGKLVGIKFVDLQLSHYGSYAIDLAYLMFTSVQSGAKERIDDLLKVYHDSLVRTFKKVNHVPANLPSLEDVKKEYKTREVFGALISCSLLHMFLAEKEDVTDLEDLVTNPDMELPRTGFLSERFRRKAQDNLKAYKNGDYFKHLTIE